MTAIGWVLLFLNIIQVGILVWREQHHDRERDKLCDRFMARDFREYIDNQPRPAPKSRNPIVNKLKERREQK